jgi:hypothetical protein
MAFLLLAGRVTLYTPGWHAIYVHTSTSYMNYLIIACRRRNANANLYNVIHVQQDFMRPTLSSELRSKYEFKVQKFCWWIDAGIDNEGAICKARTLTTLSQQSLL